MVRNAEDVKDLTKVSFSFIPSLKCNNQCSFCMYGAGPSNGLKLDYDLTVAFMKTVDWEKVVGWGLYGGEPSIDMDLYQTFYNLLPEELPKFVITNAAWSRDREKTIAFLQWCAGKFHIIVSGTPEHRAKQNVRFIEELSKEVVGAITYKPEEEEMHPMGRLARKDWSCNNKCQWHEQVMRLGIFPTGHVILQNCDGVYPVVGHIKTANFDEVFARGVWIRKEGCRKDCLNINDLLAEKDNAVASSIKG